MLRVGLTGGPGAGKSTVASMLSARGFPVLDADKVAHELYLPGSLLVSELSKAFGSGVLTPSGGIDRKALGSLVFGDRERLGVLSAIVHPRLLRELSRRLGAMEESGAPVGILEAALLLQWGPPEFVDLVVAVETSVEIRRRRLVAAGLTPEDADRRLASHSGSSPDLVDIVLQNEGTREDLEFEVRELGRKLRARAEEKD